MRLRLLVGSVLILLTAGMLTLDLVLVRHVPAADRWFPFLLLFVLAVAPAAALELLFLVPRERRPAAWLVIVGVVAVLLANWPARVNDPKTTGLDLDPWQLVLSAFTAVLMLAFLVEMWFYREPGAAVTRVAVLTWMVAYLGVLPSFLAQLRWLPPACPSEGGDLRGVAAVGLAIFVPKACDIGAFFVGKALGRNRMTPLLSPKKTWEGLTGGLALAVGVAVTAREVFPELRLALWQAVGLGLTVGLAGVLGDLAESMIKRDGGQKDASQNVPGFGGVLDVIDSILFAAPVAYAWLAW